MLWGTTLSPDDSQTAPSPAAGTDHIRTSVRCPAQQGRSPQCTFGYRHRYPQHTLSTHSSAHLHMRLFAVIRREAGRQGSPGGAPTSTSTTESAAVGHTHRPLFATQGSPLQRLLAQSFGPVVPILRPPGCYRLLAVPTLLMEVRRRTHHCPFPRRVLHTVLAALRAGLRPTGEVTLASVRFFS